MNTSRVNLRRGTSKESEKNQIMHFEPDHKHVKKGGGRSKSDPAYAENRLGCEKLGGTPK